MKKIKVYFFQKKGHRERQKDTVKYAPKEIDVVGKEDVDINNLEVYKHHNNPIRSKLVKYITKLPLINFRRLPAKHIKANFTYVWGCIPINCKNKFIVELDNPYSLTFYNSFAFNLFKPLIKYYLKSKKCYKIVCISQACKDKTIQKLGQELEPKIVVQYPYIRKLKISKEHQKTKLLFIGFDLKGKGGVELLKAFKKINNPQLELNIIGPEKKTEKTPNINWLGKQTRKSILEKHLQKNDILCLPTYYESLGMVVLEAISAGLGIITTNTFALPELVKNNGVLIQNPFLTKTKINSKLIVDPTDYTLGKFKKKYSKSMPSKKMTKELIKAIKRSKTEKEEWKKESRKIYNNKFSTTIWEKNFIKIFK